MEKNKIKKSKVLYSKIFFSITIILLLSSGVLAFFLFNYDKDVNYEVVGSKGTLLVLVDFTDQIFNVSESLNLSQNLTLVNQNGATTMQYLESFNVTNLDPGNCTINGDITFELTKSGSGIISHFDNFTMDAGVNDFSFKAMAINNRVCPQNITASLMFNEI